MLKRVVAFAWQSATEALFTLTGASVLSLFYDVHLILYWVTICALEWAELWGIVTL